jgi:hypothetical protein
MKSKSLYGNSGESIQIALEQSLTDGFKPTLAIVFISVKQDRKNVTDILAKHDIDVLGATSCGEFTDKQQSEGGITILLLQLSRSLYRIIFQPIADENVQSIASRISVEALKTFADPSLILCSTGVNTKGEYFDGVGLVQSMSNALGVDKLFFGGMAGDDGGFTGSYVFTATQETDYGCVALVLDSTKIQMHGMAVTGWKPMGLVREATESRGNLLYRIDNKPAVEMYLKYLGKEDVRHDKDFNFLEDLALSYPFIVDRGDGETLIKSPLRIDHGENALVLDMEMVEGSKFWFSTPPDFDIVEEVIEEARTLISNTAATADGLLIFSCASRPPALGPLVTVENEGLAEVWKTPMAGFFTYGEYGRAKNGKQHFHSSACCWVALKEI